MNFATLALVTAVCGLWFESLAAAVVGFGGAAAVVIVNLLVEKLSERLAGSDSGERQLDPELGVRLPVRAPAQASARAGLIVLLAMGRFWLSIAALLIVLAAAGAAKVAAIAGFVIAVVIDLIGRLWQVIGAGSD